MHVAIIILRILLWGYFSYECFTLALLIWDLFSARTADEALRFHEAFDKTFWRTVKAGACIIGLSVFK
jgi:hypothetical protein